MSAENNIVIRYCAEDEAGKLTALHEACFSHYLNRQDFDDFFGVSGTKALIAEQEGRMLAMLVYRVQYEQADIITLAVESEMRRRGIARKLLERALEDIRIAGAHSMFLDVEEGNNAAIALYKGFGFSHQRRRRQYYRLKDGAFTDALVMTRNFT